MSRRFLPLLAVISCLYFSSAAIAKIGPSIGESDDNFISISDSTIGRFEIENTPVAVSQYCDFLNAVAIYGDLHSLYNKKMSTSISYHPAGWLKN